MRFYEEYEGIPTFPNAKYYGIVAYNGDSKYLEYIIAHIETSSVNYRNISDLIMDEICYNARNSEFFFAEDFDDIDELIDYTQNFNLSAKAVQLLKKYFNDDYGFLILENDNLYVINMQEAQDTLNYFKENN